MEDDKITMYDMVAQMVRNNQFSVKQEEELEIMLAGRKEKREEERLSRCLYGIAVHELDAKVCSKEFKPSTAKRYKTIIQKCFSGKYGNMDASNLNEEILHEYITEVHESYGLSRNEMFMFMNLLKKALGKMSENGILEFVPSKNLFVNHMENTFGTKLIDCPYSYNEQVAITQWIVSHSSDVRGLACGLWLIGGDGLSPDRIINMKKQDAWKYGMEGLNEQNADNDIFDFDPAADRAKARESVIKKALSLHPEETSYVFMLPKKESVGWKKLSGSTLQIKMNWICSSLNIPFKSFHGNEAITFNN